MEKEIPIGTALTVLFLLAILAFYLFSIFHHPVDPDTHHVKYGTISVEFRSMIKDCYAVGADSKSIRQTFTNPLVQKVVLLMDPYESTDYGVSVYEVYRMTSFLGEQTVYAFTNATDQEVSVLTLEHATVEEPMIFLNISGHTDIQPFGNGVILNAEDQDALDAVACRFGLALMGDPKPV